MENDESNHVTMDITEMVVHHPHTKDTHSNPSQHIKDDDIIYGDNDTSDDEYSDSNLGEIEILSSTELTDDDKNEDGSISQSVIDKLKIESWNNYPWKCIDCGTQMVDIHDLRQHHISSHQSTSKYCCVDCPKVFNKYATFLNHVRCRHRSHLKFW